MTAASNAFRAASDAKCRLRLSAIGYRAKMMFGPVPRGNRLSCQWLARCPAHTFQVCLLCREYYLRPYLGIDLYPCAAIWTNISFLPWSPDDASVYLSRQEWSVNRLGNGTPDRLAKGTPLVTCVSSTIPVVAEP